MTEVVRSFWHGPPLNPYLLLCLGSYVSRGYPVELFTYQRNHDFPSWITARDARDILPTETVMVYGRGPGAGSPALHANLFRLLLLDRFGGWWVDTDAALLRPELPAAPFYFAVEENHYTNSIMKFPCAHPLLSEAAELAREAGADVPWATTGPTLLTALIRKHELEGWATPSAQGCPFIYTDVPAFFDPERAEELTVRASSSSFMHLCCEMWRRIGIPTNMGPPAGSFLDLQFRQSGLDIRFAGRIELRHLAVWIGNGQARGDLEATRAELNSTRAHLNAVNAATQADLESYRAMVERSRWSRLGSLLGLGPTARRARP